MVDRVSALNWLGKLGGMVAVKILIIFWMGSLWRLMFRPLRYNLAEIYVFATYALGTTGLLWALLPIIDLIVPYSLGANAIWVTGTTLCLEIAYLTYAVHRFSQLPVATCLLRVSTVLVVGCVLLAGIVSVERAVPLFLPPMPV